MPRIIAVIPARHASVRFPGKLLADRTGRPLIQHVHDRVQQARRIDEVIVAADDQRIIDAVRGFGGRAIATRVDHPNGTSRIAEAAASLECDLVVNVQGDEPEIEPHLIDLAVDHLLGHADCPMGTLASPFTPDENPADPNIVKVVLDQRGRALYFSRALIPHIRDASEGGPRPVGDPAPLKHVGMYVYRREFLATYVSLSPTPLEQAEKLEQLRVLEHGHHIAVAFGRAQWHGIDTPQQYEEFVRRQHAAAQLRG